ncbi:hypothetical protein [Lysinibacillus xylanilyticus]|uniref:Restriction endonuclease n=1 Tax=Lysinibacillus xylanilyticus TaxID=582475 RepID=A0ABV3W028_9BACI
MNSQIPIYLTSLDIVNDEIIIKATRKVANYFKNEKTHIILGDFCEMILKRSAKWGIGDVENKFSSIQEELETTYKNEQVNIYNLTRGELETAFKMADSRDKKYLGDLRGRLFEAILVGIYGGTYILEHPPPNQQRGWGVSIGIPTNSEPDVIKYVHETQDPQKSKKTMDYAYIKGVNRVFFECKIQPDRFEDAEINYFKLFHNKFVEFDLGHELCFFAADSYTEIEMEMEDYELEFPLNLLGYDNINAFVVEKM